MLNGNSQTRKQKGITIMEFSFKIILENASYDQWVYQIVVFASSLVHDAQREALRKARSLVDEETCVVSVEPLSFFA
jgi:hypothetical protein